MSWKASSVMEEKVRFVVEYERGGQIMTELWESFWISRKPGLCGCGGTGRWGWQSCFRRLLSLGRCCSRERGWCGHRSPGREVHPLYCETGICVEMMS